MSFDLESPFMNIILNYEPSQKYILLDWIAKMPSGAFCGYKELCSMLDTNSDE